MCRIVGSYWTTQRAHLGLCDDLEGGLGVGEGRGEGEGWVQGGREGGS